MIEYKSPTKAIQPIAALRLIFSLGSNMGAPLEIETLLLKAWTLIAAAPEVFVAIILVVFGAGFGAGKLFYGAVASLRKERLESARDDLARLEKDNADLYKRIERFGANAESSKITEPTQVLDDFHLSKAQRVGPSLDRTTAAHSIEVPFFLNPPFERLDAAFARATTRGVPVFAVIYDDDHPTKSKLSYSLGYFLEYQTTKKLVDEYFVGALIPVSQPGARRLIPDDDPLENCRLVVMRPDGQILRSEGVYANPDEGLKRVRSLIAQWDAK